MNNNKKFLLKQDNIIILNGMDNEAKIVYDSEGKRKAIMNTKNFSYSKVEVNDYIAVVITDKNNKIDAKIYKIDSIIHNAANTELYSSFDPDNNIELTKEGVN